MKKMFLVWVLLLVLLAACQPSGPTANDLMPDALAGYDKIEGQDLTDAIGKLAGGASLLTGNPAVAGAVLVIDEIMQCYQEAGAVAGTIFAKQDDALASGVIVIVDRNRLTNPQTFLDCVRPQGPEMAAPQENVIEPCSNSYTLSRDNNAYYFLYAATRPEVCQTFCANLEGCTP